MSTNSKWGSKFWVDLGERTAATAVGGLLGMLTLSESTPVDWTDGRAFVAVVVVPTVASFLKGLAKNLSTGTDTPTASLAGVTSTTSDIP